MKLLLMFVIPLTWMCIALSSASIHVGSSFIPGEKGAKTLRCTYFTGYSLITYDFDAHRGATSCPSIIKGPKH